MTDSNDPTKATMISQGDVVMLLSVDEWKSDVAMTINFLVVYSESNTPVFFGNLYYTLITGWELVE